MQKMKKTIALMLSAALLLLCLFGCANPHEQEQKVIGTCAGRDVLYEELRYVTLSYRDKFEATYGEGIWDNPQTAEQYRKDLENTVWEIMKNNYAVIALCQDFMDEDQMESQSLYDSVDDKMQQLIDSYVNEADYEKDFESLYMTEHFMRFCLYVSALENELFYILTQDLGLIEDDQMDFADWVEEGNGVYVQHIFVQNDKGEDVAANRAKAEEARRQLIAGEKTIDQLVGSSTNEDLENTKPYYIVRDVYTKEIEAAAFTLQEAGDVSEVVEVANGFYVLVRMEENEADFVAKIPSLLKSYQWAKLEDMVNQKKREISIALNEYGKSLDLVTLQ